MKSLNSSWFARHIAFLNIVFYFRLINCPQFVSAFVFICLYIIEYSPYEKKFLSTLLYFIIWSLFLLFSNFIIILFRCHNWCLLVYNPCMTSIVCVYLRAETELFSYPAIKVKYIQKKYCLICLQFIVTLV